MKWNLTSPEKGDMVRVKTGEIYHYGIFVSENEIVQFGLPPLSRKGIKDSEIEVCVTDANEFLANGFMERGIAQLKDGKKRKPEQTVEYAKSKLGQKGYNLLYNNCEHFAYECLFGKRKSTQTDSVKEFFKDFPVVEVYTAEIPCDAEIKFDLYPKKRNEEISECGSEKVRTEKYFVWKLLEYAVRNSFGYNIKELKFKKTENGKWLCDKCCFSLSHSFGAVAAAVSKHSVGVDIESLNEKKACVIEKTLSLNEKAELEKISSSDKQNALICFWTAKESVYKNNGTGVFKPSETDGTKNNVQTKIVKIGEKDYALSVCADNLKTVRYHENVNLYAFNKLN